jgi:chemotaxis protein histidine kinase CheA
LSSTWQSDCGSLDNSLAVLYGIVGKLRSANSVDMPQVVHQLENAAECARKLQSCVASELPDATWESRAELDALLEAVEKKAEARTIEQLRSRLFALATELEHGKITHRRALRVTQLNQLREQAINELLDHAGAEGAPDVLPGPEPEQWIGWACELKDPEDGEAISILRTRFPHLDEFVANLGPEMWVGSNGESPAAKRNGDHQQIAKTVDKDERSPAADSAKTAEVKAVGAAANESATKKERPDTSAKAYATAAVGEEAQEFTWDLTESSTPSLAERLARMNPFKARVHRDSWKLALAALVVVALVLGAWWVWHRKQAIDIAKANVEAAARVKSQPLLHRLPAEGSQDRILLTLESCDRADAATIKCWGYVANQRDKNSDVSLSRADVVDAKGNSFNLSTNGQYSFSTGATANIPAYSTVKYTLTIPDKDGDAQMLTLYLDAKNPRDVEYTFRDIPVAQ